MFQVKVLKVLFFMVIYAVCMTFAFDYKNSGEVSAHVVESSNFATAELLQKAAEAAIFGTTKTGADSIVQGAGGVFKVRFAN